MPEFEIVSLEAQPALVVSDTVPFDELPDFFGRAFTAVMAQIAASGAAPAGPPFGYYPSTPTDTVEISAGMPVAAPIETSGEVEAIELPAGRAVRGIHVGPYDTLGQTYGELQAWMIGEGLVPAAAMWENYLSDPDDEPPEEWQTEIVWPVQG